jgi:hypothetical protein
MRHRLGRHRRCGSEKRLRPWRSSSSGETGGIGYPESGIPKSGISKSDKRVISKPKSEISNRTPGTRPPPLSGNDRFLWHPDFSTNRSTSVPISKHQGNRVHGDRAVRVRLGKSEIWNREFRNLRSRNRTSSLSQSRNQKSQIGPRGPGPSSFPATIDFCGPPDFSTNRSTSVEVPKVRFKFSDFGFEITSLSDFETPDFGISDSGFPIPPA